MSPVPDAPPRVAPDRIRTDVLVVGAGIAGLYTAVQLPRGLDVVVLDKGVPGADSGSSPWAQAGLAAAIDADDDPRWHAEDTIAASDGLCDRAAVDVLAREAPGHVAHLLELGARFDRRRGRERSTDPHDLDLAREGGQRIARSVRRADATGAEVVRVLRDAAAPRVARLPGIVRGLLQDAERRVTGAQVSTDGALVTVEAKVVVLATGGCGGLFAATTNPANATGDGIALALRAGAAVRDLEFVQFHPTGLAIGGSWRLLLTEALRGAGATLHDADGRRFMLDRHHDAELAPRHVVAKAILELEDGRAWLDARHLGVEALEREFPTVLAGARQHGSDLATERVAVTPAAHYHVGGVRTDLQARTSLPGLLAVGEAASTGVHGANRMAGNSLSEALVFGARAAATIAAELPDRHHPATTGHAPGDGPDPATVTAIREELPQRMLHDAGPTRTAAGLHRVAARLERLGAELGDPGVDADAVQLHHALTAAAAIVHAATLRTESRGGHWREDHPGADPGWAEVHLERIAPVAAGG